MAVLAAAAFVFNCLWLNTSAVQFPSDELAAYAFDAGAGTTAADQSGNGNHGTISGATWTTQARYGGRALSFDGNNDRVTGPSITLTDAFTLMAWVYNPSNVPFETIVTVGANRDLYLANGRVTFYTGQADLGFGAALPTNVWQHVALTYDGIDVTAYVNGAVRGGVGGVTLNAATGPLQVGAWVVGSGAGDYFGGVIDEVRVYDRALTLEEVQTALATPIGGGGMDTTPPARSNGQPTGTLPAGTQATTIGLVTDEPATCRYAPTAGTPYGSMPNVFATTGSTTHATQVSGLSGGRGYSYYVRCQDGAGNANATDYIITFAVASADATPPTVAVTAPAPGATVSGTTSVTASASDNVGVAGVQFLLDGANLGAEDLVAPYALSWNTATAADGSHSLQAVARDAAGNRTTAMPVTVTVDNGQPGGYALQFTGTGTNVNRVDIRLDGPARPVDVGATDFTLEWWMKVNAGDVNPGNVCQTGRDGWIQGNLVFDRDVDGSGDYGDYGVSLFGTGLAFGVASGTGGGGICGGTNLADGQWHHVAVTRRRSDGRLQIYVDGRLDGSGSGPAGDVSYRDGRATSVPQSDPFLVIGAEKHGYFGPNFRGLVDEVRVSTVLRYTSTFARPTAPFVPDASTAALYHFDEGQGNVVNDASGAVGGPSQGTRRFGGSPGGPAWVTDTPFR